MKLEKVSAYALVRKVKGKKIICFGAGQRLDHISQDFPECSFEKKYSCIVDNNSKLWGNPRNVNGTKIEIKSPEYLRNYTENDAVVLITTDRVKAVFQQLEEYEVKLPCYQYPTVRYKASTMWNWLFRLIPLRNTILLQGEGDSCENALAVSEYMKENGLINKYKIAWLCSHPDRFAGTDKEIFINRRTEFEERSIWKIWKYHYYRSTSKYLMYENKYIQKYRNDQISVYMKHGTFMLKDVKGRIVIPSNVNHAICTSENYAAHAADQESINQEKLLICGSPRLDFLYQPQNVLCTLGYYMENVRYMIWLPTMRQASYSSLRVDSKKVFPYGIPLVESEKDFELLNNRLREEKTVLIIKPHPRQDLSVFKIEGYSNIVLIPQEKLDEYMFTIHSLMRECDALISDYSSIAFDYMLLDRPMAYTTDDMDEYSIGFSVEDPFKYMPGKKLNTVDDLIRFIEDCSVGKDDYKTERRKVRDFIHQYQDQNNSKRFLELLGII